MVFMNAGELLCFFDLSGTETLRIDELLWGIQFFIGGANRLKETLMLFQQLDANTDGVLDETELEALFNDGMQRGRDL